MSTTIQPTLKQLNTKKMQLQQELDELVAQSKTLSNKQKAKREEILTVDAQIVRATLNVTVSEHAILRYVERVLNIDIEAIKAKILQPQIKEQIQTLGNGTYPVNGEFKVRVRNNVIVTITHYNES